MAYEAYFKWEGTKQGKSKGESPRDKFKDYAAILAYNHVIEAPRDIATGQASGKRQHRPIKVTKEWGASSPQLFGAVTTNEVIKTVVFEFYKTNANGEEYMFHKVTLTDAAIAGQRKFTGLSAKHEATNDTMELEEISFTYRKIEVESIDGKVMASDDWKAQG